MKLSAAGMAAATHPQKPLHAKDDQTLPASPANFRDRLHVLRASGPGAAATEAVTLPGNQKKTRSDALQLGKLASTLETRFGGEGEGMSYSSAHKLVELGERRSPRKMTGNMLNAHMARPQPQRRLASMDTTTRESSSSTTSSSEPSNRGCNDAVEPEATRAKMGDAGPRGGGYDSSHPHQAGSHQMRSHHQRLPHKHHRHHPQRTPPPLDRSPKYQPSPNGRPHRQHGESQPRSRDELRHHMAHVPRARGEAAPGYRAEHGVKDRPPRRLRPASGDGPGRG